MAWVTWREVLRQLTMRACDHMRVRSIRWAPRARRAFVTHSLRDVARGELKFPTLRMLTPEKCLEAFPCPP